MSSSLCLHPLSLLGLTLIQLDRVALHLAKGSEGQNPKIRFRQFVAVILPGLVINTILRLVAALNLQPVYLHSTFPHRWLYQQEGRKNDSVRCSKPIYILRLKSPLSSEPRLSVGFCAMEKTCPRTRLSIEVWGKRSRLEWMISRKARGTEHVSKLYCHRSLWLDPNGLRIAPKS